MKAPGSTSNASRRARTGAVLDDSLSPSGVAGSSSAPAPPVVAGPQFTIVDGRITLDRSSLVHRREADVIEAMVEEQEDLGKFTTQLSFLKRSQTARWSKEETTKFYSALRTCGLDFTLMAPMFPKRTRMQVRPCCW